MAKKAIDDDEIRKLKHAQVRGAISRTCEIFGEIKPGENFSRRPVRVRMDTNQVNIENFKTSKNSRLLHSFGPFSAVTVVPKCNVSNASARGIAVKLHQLQDGRTSRIPNCPLRFSENTLDEIYQNIPWSVESRCSPVLGLFEVEVVR